MMASVLWLILHALILCVLRCPSSSAQATDATPEDTTSAASCPVGCHCDYTTRTVNCQQAVFTSVPTGFPSYTTTLMLSNNAIKTLPENSFQGLSNLVSLTLTSSQIATIEPGAFNGLENLHSLDLQSNHIAALSPGGFSGMPNLRELNLDRNRIQNIPDSVFEDVTNLQVLNINNNPIFEIHDGAFKGLSSLSALYLKYGQLREVPSIAMQNLTILRTLAFSGNPIPTLPGMAFSTLSSLNLLYVDSMQLTSVDADSFTGLDEVNTIDLAYNHLPYLNPVAFETLGNLKTLILTGNLWDCTCPLLEFVQWLQQNSISFHTTSWYCTTPSNLNGNLVYAVPPSAFACEPVITTVPSDTTVTYLNRAIFQCRANGDPSPFIEWYTPTGRRVTATSNVENVYTALSGTVLIVESATEIDGGIYNCTATNARGFASVLFRVIVTDIPTPTTVSLPPSGSNTTGMATGTTPDLDRSTCINFAVQTEIDSVTGSTITVSWAPYIGLEVINGYIIQWHIFGDTDFNSNYVNWTDATYSLENLYPNTGYTLCVAVLLENCPLFTSQEQCREARTQGVDPVIAANNIRHRNEIIGTALAVFLGTLFLMATVFLILWRYRKPKNYSQYNFKSNKKTAAFAGIAEDVNGGELLVGESDVIVTDETPSGSDKKSSLITHQQSYTNLGMDISPEENIYVPDPITEKTLDIIAEQHTTEDSKEHAIVDVHSDELEPSPEYNSDVDPPSAESDTGTGQGDMTDTTVSMKSSLSEEDINNKVREPKDKPSKVKKSKSVSSDDCKPSLSSDESLDINENGLEMSIIGQPPIANGDLGPHFEVEIV